MKLKQSRVRFDGEAHTYTLDGKILQGITGMIDRRIFGGKYSNTDPDFLRPFAEYGTLVHSELDTYFTVGIQPTNDDARSFVNWFEAFTSYDKAVGEYTVSDESHFATNIDLVCGNDANVHLFDFKTSKELDMERVRWQLSICSYLFELQNGFAPSFLFVAHLRDGVCKVVSIEPIEREKVIELLEAEKGGLSPVSDTMNIQRLVDIETALIMLQNEAKRLETMRDEALSIIEKEMERTGTKKIDTERLMITRVLPATTQRLDTKKLEAENPDLCARYKVPSEKKGFIRLTIKNNDPTV